MSIGVYRSSVLPTFALGDGLLAGQPPDPADPDSPDGRFRILNVPAQGRVTIHERGSMVCVASTLSANDGTWEVAYLNRSLSYFVVGWDDRGLQNAAIQDWITPVAMG